jgi:myo-inositol-1-phosphate synthase
MRRTLVCMVGLSGATASTAAATILDLGQMSPKTAVASTTAGPSFANLNLLEPREFDFAGWDFVGETLAEAVWRHGIYTVTEKTAQQRLKSIKSMPGWSTGLDIPAEATHTSRCEVTDPERAVENISRQVSDAQKVSGADHACVIYLGSPYRSLPQGEFIPENIATVDDLRNSTAVSSSFLYALGAIRAGADFVDFTPGRILDSPLLTSDAVGHGTQLAGSDGSTGQTMLKHALADLFRSRGMQVRGWYSTNVLGNHDGYVLSIPEHSQIKIQDKSDGLLAIMKDGDLAQSVQIDYLPPWGDNKESWDAIELSGWIEGQISLRVNWRGPDSMLASAMIFDICRLLRLGHDNGMAGIRQDLGYFFKRPIGRRGRTPAELYAELLATAGAIQQ